ncbi:hypothetical protein XhyaCFBP1156_20945 [Xanthomonas hyacinthi]|uniref:Ammonium transporter AmtB-like domain-containing protein n=1 Tax=Xanthomonas hyacinthi TaxID=56455 RepID=A0A2S7ENA9_9XANT|nr:hypothetical protein XhyaCFBP1156_20945 [Xanthomonas hyacinthi]
MVVQPLVLFVWVFVPALAQGADLPWDQVGLMSLMAVLFAAPFVLVLGVPLTIFLHRTQRLRLWPLALAGAIAGGIFIGWRGPGYGTGFSSGGNWYGKYVDFVIDGEPTLYGWLSYLQSIAGFALHGLVGATVFYLVWARWMGPNNSFKPKPLSGSV